MHRSEQAEEGNCVVCGAEISTTDRVFAIGGDALLCLSCALARHGTYDELHDRWTTPPRVDDLMQYVRDDAS